MARQVVKGGLLALLLTGLIGAGHTQASEPASVYLRCTMSPEQYAAAMAAPLGQARDFDDWQNWFDGADLYGSGKVDADSLRDADTANLEQLTGAWVGRHDLSSYDKKTGRWQFALLQFTENYGEMIQLLAPLRAVAPYCAPDSDSFLLIWGPVWGNGVNAYLPLNHKRSRFEAKPTPAQLKEADAVLDTLMSSEEN